MKSKRFITVTVIMVLAVLILLSSCAVKDVEYASGLSGIDDDNDTKSEDTTSALESDEDDPDVSVSPKNFLVTVKSSDVELKSYEHYVGSQTYDKYGWLCTDGFSISGQFSEFTNEIPQITYGDGFEIVYGDNVELISLSVYNSNSEYIRVIDENGLKELSKGEYYLMAFVKKLGEYVEEDKMQEFWAYECVYKLVIA